jgi:imidazolonepropionase-like amidohydrolase
VEVGKLAALVVLDGDPTTDITATRNVTLVAKEGTVYRNELKPVG